MITVIGTTQKDGGIDMGDRDIITVSEYTKKYPGRKIEITYKIIGEKKARSLLQNNALHKWFELLAIELNERGLDMKKVLERIVSIPWKKETIKECLFKPIMNDQVLKDSTADLTSKEVDEVFETINRFLAEEFGVHIPFPSITEYIQ